MRISLLACIWIGAATVVVAQPVIQPTHFPGAGMTFTDVTVDATSLQPGGSGAGQTWNFAGATPTGTTLDREYISPSGTPYMSFFPGSNLCERSDDGAGGFTYLYFDHGSAQTNLMGYGWVLTGQNVHFDYTNQQTWLAYPVSYNGTHFDSFAGSYTATISGLTYTDFRSGTYEYTADAWGSMSNPVGTYPNCLRLRIRQHIKDSLVYTNPPLPPNVSVFNATTYNWMSGDAGHYLNQFYLSYDTVTAIGSSTASKNAYYQDAVTSAGEIPFSLSAEIYPNPVADHAFFILHDAVSGDAVLTLYDMHGREVMRHATRMTAAARFEWMFPASGLSPGIYWASVYCGQKKWIARVVKW